MTTPDPHACDRCEFVGRNARGINVHRAHKHGDRLVRISCLPGSSVVVSVGVDGTTSTHQLEQVGWFSGGTGLWPLEPGPGDSDVPVYRLVAVPVRDPGYEVDA